MTKQKLEEYLLPKINGTVNAKRSTYGDKKSHDIGAISLNAVFIVLLERLSMYKLKPRDILALPMIYSNNKFHPTINAANSPIVQYVKMYADPDLGTLDANSA